MSYSMPIPKKVNIHIIFDMSGGAILEALQEAGVHIGEPRYRGAPNIFYGCWVEPNSEAHLLLDSFMEQGELIYVYD